MRSRPSNASRNGGSPASRTLTVEEEEEVLAASDVEAVTSEESAVSEGDNSMAFVGVSRLLTGVDHAPYEGDQARARTYWQKFAHQDNPNIFGNIIIANDGGFSEVKDLWYNTRYLAAGLTLAFIASNLYFIILVDCSILMDLPVSGDMKDQETRQEMFLLTAPASRFLFHDHVTRQGDDLIAYFELFGLTVILAHAAHQLCKAHGAKSSRLKWFAIDKFFWHIVPQLSSYSAMRLLHYVSPTVFLSTLFALVHEAKLRGLWWNIRAVSKFVLFHMFCLVIGFDAFLVKIRAAYGTINQPHMRWRDLYGALVFMVQVLGVIRLGTFVQQRLFIFIFAGEDAIMHPEERAKQHVWSAMLVKKFWEEYTFPRFVALMLTFGDNDFQRLVLNDNDTKQDEKCKPDNGV